jgi:hypothetical protein
MTRTRRTEHVWPSRNIACPKCQAVPGQACMSTSGRDATVPHIERRNAYRDEIGAKHVQRR